MPEQEVTNSDTTKRPLGERAREVEEQWRAELGLRKGLHRRGNAMAREARRRVECPKEPKAAVRYRRYRKKQLGKFGAASEVRRIDPDLANFCLDLSRPHSRTKAAHKKRQQTFGNSH